MKIASIEEKGLTLEDTQGMFLLLGAGFLLAAVALLSEWMGGFSRCPIIGRKIKSSKTSAKKFINTPQDSVDDTHSNSGSQSHLHFLSRSPSNESQDTVEGHIIDVTQESITVHNNFDEHEWDSRRSSSVDLDGEVQGIFQKRPSNDIEDLVNDKTEFIAKDVFGEHL